RRAQTPAAAPRGGPLCRRPHHDADRPPLTADPRLVDPANLCPAQRRPEGWRSDDRAPFPPLWPVRGPRLLALSDPRLGEGDVKPPAKSERCSARWGIV